MPDARISELPAVTAAALINELEVNEGGTSKKATLAQLRDLLGRHKAALSADVTNALTTTAKVAALDYATGVGTFVFQYFIRYQSALATTGVRFDVNHTGTVSTFVWNQRWVDTSATASTAAPDQDNIQAAGAVMGAFASRAKGTTGRGTTISVDTANGDMLMLIEGLMIVTVAGNLELWQASEVAGTSVVKAGTSLLVDRTA